MASNNITLTLSSSQTLSNANFYVNGTNYNYGIANGLNLFIYSGFTVSTTVSSTTFQFLNYDTTTSSTVGDQMAQVLENLPPQTMIAVLSVGNTPAANISARLIRVLGIYGSYALNTGYPSGQNWTLIGSRGTMIGSGSEQVSGQDLTVSQVISPPPNPLNLITVIGDTTPDLQLNGKSYGVVYGDGITVVVLNQQTLALVGYQTHNTCTSSNSSDKFVQNINSLGTDVIIVLQVKGNFKNKLKTDAVSLIKSTLGSTMIDSVQNQANNQWFLLNKKFGPYSPMEFYSTANKIIGQYYALGIHETSDSAGEHIDEEGTVYRVSAGSSNRNCGVNNFSMVSGFQVTDQYPSNSINYLGIVVLDDQNGIVLNQAQYNLSSSTDITNAVNYLAHNVTIGNLVMVTLSQVTDISNLTDSLKIQISSLGGFLFDNITTQSSYCLIGRKGNSPGSVTEYLTDDYSGICLSSDFDFVKSYTRPFIEVDAQSVGTCAGSSDSPYIQLNHSTVPITFATGMNVVVIDPSDGTIQLQQTYNTSTSTTDSAALAQMINNLSAGMIVAIVVKDDAATSLTADAKTAIGTLGSQVIQNIATGNSFSIIGVKGGSISQVTECLSTNSKTLCSNWLFVNDIFHQVPAVEISLHSAGVLSGNQDCHIYINGADSGLQYKNGLNVVTLDQSGNIQSKQTFSPVTKNGQVDDDNDGSVQSMENFTDYVLSLPPGTIVVAAVKTRIGQLSSRAIDGFKMIGSEYINFVQPKGSFSIIGIKGAGPGSILENYSNSTMCSISTALPISQTEGHPEFLFAILLGITLFAAFSLIITAQYIETKYQPHYPGVGLVADHIDLSSSGEPPSNKRALFVSIKYEHVVGSTTIPGAGQGLRGLMRTLINVGYLDGRDCKFLTDETADIDDNSGPDNKPSRINVTNEITNWLLKDIQPGKVVFLAYLGHCNRVPPPPTSGPIQPFQYCYLSTLLEGNDNQRSSLKNTDLQALFNGVPLGVNVTWLMNCCFAKGVSIPNSNPTLSNNLIALNTQDENHSAVYKASMIFTMKSYLSRQKRNSFTNYQNVFNETQQRMSESNNPSTPSLVNFTTKNLSSLQFLGPLQ